MRGWRIFQGWFDPIKMAVRTKVRGFLETMIEEELSAALCRPRYGRRAGPLAEDSKAACLAVATSLEEAGDRLFTFTRFPPCQWKSIRTSNAIERLHEEFKRRIETQPVLPAAETGAMLFRALMASGQITMRKVDGWRTLCEKPSD